MKTNEQVSVYRRYEEVREYRSFHESIEYLEDENVIEYIEDEEYEEEVIDYEQMPSVNIHALWADHLLENMQMVVEDLRMMDKKNNVVEKYVETNFPILINSYHAKILMSERAPDDVYFTRIGMHIHMNGIDYLIQVP